ncbi:YecA family protein [Desulfogranum japonicum]|uniref:YecA family protein n=1 Tax=Desulfogranum japonicum TaxID=231447 RepID=UPI000421A3BB|nr:SEC-C metal-binding domain-containing protein [Desulfogranum japonicum]
MGKIGRNQPCPCGSGKKYKHCCRTVKQVEQQITEKQDGQVTLTYAIEQIQRAAVSHKEDFFELGVFIFFSNGNGDAWLLEVSESDAIQLARDGELLEVPIEETPETIEVNWSHTFAIENKQLCLTSYEDKNRYPLDNVPTQRISAAIRRMKKRFSPELLEQVHISQP